MKSLLALGLLAILCAPTVQTQEKSAEMIAVKYDGLKQEVAKHRGKVVLVDFWGGL